ncbi:MAG: ABC transporter ATP-binding protein [Ilumatobacter sp.]|nr:ABC transporter ATP-binding protein [Ilumatobacter sp.]
MSARLVLSNVAKTFEARDITVAAVAGIDLTIEPGETVTLLGPSGCGKTTVLRLIAGLETPSSGEISVGGEAPVAVRARKEIGFIPQSPALFPWRTVRANARLLLDINRRAGTGINGHAGLVDDLLGEVGLGEFSDAYPHELSGGMQQRVGLVRAFALGARIMLMDEPFAALDEITRTEMRYLLERLREQVGATVVFVTHSIAEAAFLSDRVAVMSPRPGRITDIVDIAIERPRLPSVEDTAEFFELTKRLRTALHAGGTA